ncbi:DNA-3-methyladenine glycosylase 2 [Marinobacterium arenosum]|uniref:DNA-3-methyladenine glycosylase 2 n=1 Tax=Marinobacterium arenosum TaxID=2862496 RepID=UPI001C95955D|nr:DNA-3-methyladenine glycosylase 2 [Marinobacterium arenosum]MBY4677323.1 DNA-3-methyladenine glycosylase 2 [Marinobacterium arenosum]
MNSSHLVPADQDACYRALTSRDRRFDGRFFVGVTSTGIYCRPICPVRPPKQANCRFFQYAAQAEQAGFRPCLRCRPELAPGLATVDLTQQLADSAARMMQADPQPGRQMARLAARLGISDRHLRRIFQARFGVSPLQYLQSCRLLLAKQLLSDTDLPVTEIALLSGFGSVRRLNSLFQQQYRLTPTALRKQLANGPAREQNLQLLLSYRPPYDWPQLLAFLSQRIIPGVEAVGQHEWQGYRRTISWHHQERTLNGWLQVTPTPEQARLRVEISRTLTPLVAPLLQRVRQLFDLNADPALINERLGELAADRPGLRVPGCFDGFEMAVRAILGQQVSVKAAHTLAGRLVERFGNRLETPFSELDRSFPTAAILAAAAPEQIAELGIVRQRAQAIIQLARSVDSQQLRLNADADIEQTLTQLQALPGIGPWTAQYIAMRALAWPDAFPHTDLGVMKALGSRQPKQLLARAEAWRPWRAYAVMHLWCAPE